jgi:PAS domain S-box-containing protein
MSVGWLSNRMAIDTVIYLLPYILSVIISTSVGIVTWKRRSIAGAHAYSIFALLQASWTLGYIFELLSSNQAAKIFWDNTQFIGMLFSPLAFLLFTFEYLSADMSKIRSAMKWLLGLSSVGLLLVFTDDFHGLIHSQAWIVPGEPFSALKYDFSLTFLLMGLYVYVLTFYGIFKLVQRYLRPGRLYRNQILTVLIGVFIPLIGAALTLVGVEFSIHRDTTPITFAIGNLVVAFGLFRYRLFEIVPIARELVFTNMSDSVVILDGQNRVVDINPAALTTLNLVFSEIIGKSVAEVFSPFPDLLKRYMEMDEFHEVVTIDANGVPGYHDIRITPIRDRQRQLTGRLIVVRNISEEVQAQKALFESEAKYRNLVESTKDWVWVVDLEGRHTYSNQAIRQLLGFEVDEIVGSSAFPHMHPEDQERVHKMMQDSMNEKCGWSDVSIRWLHKDGSIRFMESTAEPMLDSSGKIIGFSGIDRDVTERMQAEEEIRQHASRLELANRKLEEANTRLQILDRVKDEFVANVSHELRTPITSLRLYLNLLSSRPEKWNNYMDTLERETERLGSMIESLLQLSRLDQKRVSIEFERVDLNRIVDEYVNDRKPLAEKSGIDLSLKIENELPVVRADPRLIGQVLSIFLTNAINYTSSGGSVIVCTQERNEAEKRYVGFCVSDNGPGITREEQEQLFTRFFRGKAGRESDVLGTGLGLAIAKEIVDEHNGLIEVESRGIPGEGTTFRVWLQV